MKWALRIIPEMVVTVVIVIAATSVLATAALGTPTPYWVAFLKLLWFTGGIAIGVWLIIVSVKVMDRRNQWIQNMEYRKAEKLRAAAQQEAEIDRLLKSENVL